MEKIAKSDWEWRKQLTAEQYHVMRQKGTEQPFSGEYTLFKGQGVYRCAACGQALFDSDAKYESGSGWPSFWAAVDEGAIDTHKDLSHGMVRTEILCRRCGGHLGHVFEDGPQPTGLRYCVNSVALQFDPDQEQEAE